MSPVLGQIIALTVFIAILILIYLIPPVNQWVSKTWQSFSSQVEPTDAEGNPSLLGQLPIPAPLPNNNQDTINEETPSSQANSNQGNLFEEETTETLNTDTDNVEPEVTEVNTLNLNSESTETNEIVTETIETAEDTQNNNEEQNTPVEETTTNDSNDSIKVRLVFNKEVWMRIKDRDNETVFEGLNKAETEQTIELQKPLTFRVGNAQGLSLFIDDQPTDITTYINGSIANFTLE